MGLLPDSGFWGPLVAGYNPMGLPAGTGLGGPLGDGVYEAPDTTLAKLALLRRYQYNPLAISPFDGGARWPTSYQQMLNPAFQWGAGGTSPIMPPPTPFPAQPPMSPAVPGGGLVPIQARRVPTLLSGNTGPVNAGGGVAYTTDFAGSAPAAFTQQGTVPVTQEGLLAAAGQGSQIGNAPTQSGNVPPQPDQPFSPTPLSGVPAAPPPGSGGSLVDSATALLDNPAIMGLANASLSLLAQSGRRPYPVTLAEGLGNAGLSGINAAQNTLLGVRRQQLANEELQGRMLTRQALAEQLRSQVAQRERMAMLQQQLAAAKTPEEQQAVLTQMFSEDAFKAQLKANEPYTLGQGDQRRGPNGALIAEGGSKPPVTVEGGADPNNPQLRQHFAWNPETKAYDIPVGKPYATQPLIQQVQERAYEAKKGGNLAETMDKLQQGALQSSANLGRFTALGDMLNQVSTGKFKGSTTEIKRVAKSAGIDLDALGVKDDVAPAQAATALARQMALELRNPNAGSGMPGSLSDADRRYLESMIPSIESDPKAWPILIDIYKKVAQRNIDLARMARAYEKQNGQLDYGFIDQVERYSNSNPLFTGAVPGAAAPEGGGGLGGYQRFKRQ